MTVVERSHTNDRYHITLDIDMVRGQPHYTVQACPMIGDHLCGLPVRQVTYTMNEKDKAIRTYNRYVKKYV